MRSICAKKARRIPIISIRAFVDIGGVHEWTEAEATNQGKHWQPGYFCWPLENIRTVEPGIKAVVKRRIYTIDVADKLPF